MDLMDLIVSTALNILDTGKQPSHLITVVRRANHSDICENGTGAICTRLAAYKDTFGA